MGVVKHVLAISRLLILYPGGLETYSTKQVEIKSIDSENVFIEKMSQIFMFNVLLD
jgi:hypothetical protein